jgi:cyanophycin synthetase
MTPYTTAQGVVYAKNKRSTADLLKKSGLPGAEHVTVKTWEDTLAAAHELGYPVVVKPYDRDNGQGVYAGITNDQDLKAAYTEVTEIVPEFLVERHFDGVGHRFTIHNNQVITITQKHPATVVGDGINTVKYLIENHQSEARRIKRPNNNEPFVVIGINHVQMTIDHEVEGMLAQQNVTVDSVLKTGESMQLRRRNNASAGGLTRAIDQATVHPDNKALCLRAARILDLDIAGVDLITPDITRSWREVGGAVTEINALPQVSIQTDPTMFQRLLQKIMPHSGRIPLLFVLTEEAKPVWLDDVLDELEASGLRVGLTTTEGLQVGNDWIRGLRSSVWEDIRLLQKDPSVGAIVIISDGDTLLQTGLPFDAVNALVVQANRPQVLSLLMPYVSGVKLEVGQDWQICSHGHDAARDLTQAIVSALLQAESEYGKPAHL